MAALIPQVPSLQVTPAAQKPSEATKTIQPRNDYLRHVKKVKYANNQRSTSQLEAATPAKTPQVQEEALTPKATEAADTAAKQSRELAI